MKVKELKKTVNVCWSPEEQYPVMVAAGSAAQQVDSSFSSTSVLELYSLNLGTPGLDLELKSSLPTQQKFQKLAWSGSGIIVGGCDGGVLEFYNADKLLKNANDALVASSTKHNGPVTTLDINPYQKNLLASGASESEIFIWDLNNTTQPMAPGNRSQPYEHVQALAWNRQVQHILGSTFTTRCVVWDLRKNEPIMKLSDCQSRTRWRSMAWHPAVATQLCIASEDDQNPVIQLWDLRLAASPLQTLAGHQLGVMSLSWSERDPELLLSSGKDGKIMCWNPNDHVPGADSGVELCALGTWVSEVSLSPRSPSLLLAAAAPQPAAVLALLAAAPVESEQSQSELLDSFGGGLPQLPAVSAEAARIAQPHKPPAWMRTPTRARFAFGGKLVTFGKCPEANTPKQVYISQVVSDPEILEKCTELESLLNLALSQDPSAMDALAEYCREKGSSSSDQSERFAWYFLRANFMNNFRHEVLDLLGFKQDDVASKLKLSAAVGDNATNNISGLSRGESTETEAELSTDTSTDLSDAHTLIERKLASMDLNVEVKDVLIPNGEDSTSQICRALVCGHIEEAVDLCIEADRLTDALVIASLGSTELVQKVQQYHLSRSSQDPISLISRALLRAEWARLAGCARADSWRHVLAAHLTHCAPETLIEGCELLGDKLSSHPDPKISQSALLCYLVGGCADKAAGAWRGGAGAGSGAGAAERAVLLRSAAALRGRGVQPGGTVEAVISSHALSVACAGALHAASSVLTGVRGALPDRLAVATGAAGAGAGAARPVQQQPTQRVRTTSSQSRRTHGHTQLEEQHYNNNAMAPNNDQAWGQPPRPSSQGSHTGGLISRSKYKVDPSVQAPSLYNNYNFSNPISNQPQSQYGYNNPMSDQFAAASVPTSNYGQVNPQLNPMNPPHAANLNPVNTMKNLNPAPLNPMTPAPLIPLNPSLNPGPQSMNGGYYNPQLGPVETATAALPPTKPAAPGWNDPPMLTTKAKAKQEVQSQAPITHPLFGVEPPPQQVPLNQYPGQNQQYPGQFPGQNQQYPGQNQFPGQNQQYPGQNQPLPGQNQFPGQGYPGQMPGYPGHFDQQNQTPFVPGMNQYPQQSASPAPAEPPAPVQKPPLSADLLPLQNTFDSLRNECANRANNPQMKRKLEDVHRRLETMYDMLRENKLSDVAISVLQSAAAAAAAGDHAAAVSAATSLAAGDDFAAVAAFLPGLKVLFQLSETLQVYLR